MRYSPSDYIVETRWMSFADGSTSFMCRKYHRQLWAAKLHQWVVNFCPIGSNLGCVYAVLISPKPSGDV